MILFAAVEFRMKMIILSWIILSWIILSGMIQSWSNIALTRDGTNIPKKSEVNLERILLEQFVN